MAAMRRTLAIALAAGLLFLGGCGRARAPEPAAPAPAATTTAATTAPTSAAKNDKTDKNGGKAVDDLLDHAGQQLSDDAQAPEDED
jgi:hypothetical protein